MSVHTYETIIRAFKIFSDFGKPTFDSLWWRTDGDYAPLTLFVSCNDLFFWASSDAQKLEPEDLDDLEQAVKECEAAGDEGNGALLWVCRKRKMRPQKPYYRYFEKNAVALFDACGPEREGE